MFKTNMEPNLYLNSSIPGYRYIFLSIVLVVYLIRTDPDFYLVSP